MFYRCCKADAVFLYAFILRKNIGRSIIVYTINLANVCISGIIVVSSLYIHLDYLNTIRNVDGILVSTKLDVVSS